MNDRRLLLQSALAAALSGTTPASQAQASRRTITIPAGNDQLQLAVQHFGQGGLRYISLHENEKPSVHAARQVLQHRSGTLIELLAQGARLVSFRDGARRLRFDPNRIFTEAGTEATLRRHGANTASGRSAARALREAILALLEGRPDEPVVALHNNAGTSYTVDVYRPGGAYAGEARKLALHPKRSRDAFFLVTRQSLFDTLGQSGFNVVLQCERPTDDGSLSVWFQQQGRSYVNVEAGFGAQREQEEMLNAVAALGSG